MVRPPVLLLCPEPRDMVASGVEALDDVGGGSIVKVLLLVLAVLGFLWLNMKWTLLGWPHVSGTKVNGMST
jgi:hypothetical protein